MQTTANEDIKGTQVGVAAAGFLQHYKGDSQFYSERLCHAHGQTSSNPIAHLIGVYYACTVYLNYE